MANSDGIEGVNLKADCDTTSCIRPAPGGAEKANTCQVENGNAARCDAVAGCGEVRTSPSPHGYNERREMKSRRAANGRTACVGRAAQRRLLAASAS
jgi:hypothetical protein